MIQAQKDGLWTGCMGRQEVEVSNPTSNSVLISITDPGSKYPIIQGKWDDVLYLQFWDVTETFYEKVGGEEVAYFPIQPHEAKLIYLFVERYQDKHINIHCEAGVSRSAAVREFLIRRGWKIGKKQQRRCVFPNIIVLNLLERLDRHEFFSS